MIQIHPGIFLIVSLLLLVLPLEWLSSILVAACLHEFCHLISLYFLNGKILSIKVQPDGCVIETSALSAWKQFISIAAGPLGSFMLLLFYRISPKVAVSGLIQGLYNLIPVLPLDGGRMLDLLLSYICPGKAEVAMDWVTVVICLLFDILAIISYAADISKSWMPIFAVLWNIRILQRKIPCKQS